MVVVRSRGPSHCTSNCGAVEARNTRSRGPLKSRLITICGMPCSAVISVLLIVVSVQLGAFNSVRSAAAGVALLVGLQRREQVGRPLVALVPEALVAGQPGGHIAKRLGLQVAEPGGGAPGPRDEA